MEHRLETAQKETNSKSDGKIINETAEDAEMRRRIELAKLVRVKRRYLLVFSR